jgi:hypothetical protein
MDELFHKSSRLPDTYENPWFWCIRFLLACMGGAFGVAYKIDNPIAAIQIGASAALIIKGLARFHQH